MILLVSVCGGDGTVGWVLSEIDNINWSSHGKPPVGIIPLGTGNDLSRSLYWGGRYKDKPIKKVLHDVEMANIEPMDRWSLDLSAKKDAEKHPKARDEDFKVLDANYQDRRKRKLAEAMYIRDLKPALNKQKESYKLTLFA